MTRRNLAIVAGLSEQSLHVLGPLLADLGLTAITAQDGHDALRLIEQERPSLILAEANLRELDGYSVSSRLRKHEPTRSLPIVLIGAESDREGRLAALKAGADDFLSQPLDAEDTRLRLTALLRRTGHGVGRNGSRAATTASDGDETSTPGGSQDYESLVGLVNDVLDQARRGKAAALDALRGRCSAFVHRTNDLQPMIARALGPRDQCDLARHHVNVSIIALAIAKELELAPPERERCTLVALIHDLGMVQVPESILTAPRRLSREEFRIVAEHPRHTYEMIRAAGRDYEDLAEIAYQEHEREKGQGYPRGLRGDQIHELAKIVGVADVYEACTHARPYRKTFIPYDALQELIEMRGDYFHPRYIKALMNSLTVYPIGSYVQLNTGEVGVVQATNRKNLMRPEVKLLWNARGEQLTSPKLVDLAENPFLFVSKPLYEDRLPKTSETR